MFRFSVFARCIKRGTILRRYHLRYEYGYAVRVYFSNRFNWVLNLEGSLDKLH